MKTMLIVIIQAFVVVAIAPLVSGVITKIKNNLRMRIGPSIFQPYYNLAKLFSKGEVVSATTSWIFRAAPAVLFASSLTAIMCLPVFGAASPLGRAADLIALIFILGLGRFFLALAALDAGSAFGGMGSSREMFIAALAEPAVCLAFFALTLQYGTTAIAGSGGMHPVSVAAVVCACALIMITIAETARVPVDNQETHLELTMVHEAMFLEYSGRPLAMIELSAHVKQLFWFFLIAQVVFPIGVPLWGNPWAVAGWALWYAGRIGIIVLMVAGIEIAVAKMRLFRVPDFLWFSFVLGVVAILATLLGV